LRFADEAPYDPIPRIDDVQRNRGANGEFFARSISETPGEVIHSVGFGRGNPYSPDNPRVTGDAAVYYDEIRSGQNTVTQCSNGRDINDELRADGELPSEFCQISGTDTHSCSGDSGGPIVQLDEYTQRGYPGGGDTLVGTVSLGIGCYFAFDVSTAHFKDWICSHSKRENAFSEGGASAKLAPELQKAYGTYDYSINGCENGRGGDHLGPIYPGAREGSRLARLGSKGNGDTYPYPLLEGQGLASGEDGYTFASGRVRTGGSFSM
jgi:hypothetical protein